MTLPTSSPDANSSRTQIVFDSTTKLPLGLTAQNLTSANALHVAIVDGTGTQITSFGGGTQYTNGAAQATPVGTVALGWDGANVRALSTDSSGRQILGAGGQTIGAVTQASGPWTNNLTQVGGAAIALGQALAAASLPVVLTAAQITTLTPPTNTGYALDASLTTIDTDLKANITLHAGTNLIGKVGIDQTTPGTTNAIALTSINAATALAGNGTTGTGSLRITVASDNSAIALWGHGATAGTVPANATYKGIRGSTALPTAVTDGQLVGAFGDKYGRQVALLGTIRDLVGTQTTTISASTAETTIVTAAVSIFNDLTLLVVSNTSASTNTRIDFRDTTGGTVLFSLQSIGGANPVGFSLGGAIIPQTSVNTNWTAQCATSTTDVRVYAVFAKNK